MSGLVLRVNLRSVYREVFHFIDWANKCSNRKTKMRLIKKALKELKKVDKKTVKKRIFNI